MRAYLKVCKTSDALTNLTTPFTPLASLFPQTPWTFMPALGTSATLTTNNSQLTTKKPPQKKSEPPDWEAPKGLGHKTYIYLLFVDLCSVSEVVCIVVNNERSIECKSTITIIGNNYCTLLHLRIV